MYDKNKSCWGEIILGGIAAIFLATGMKSCNRDYSHMIYIDDGYVYHEESHIIYIESGSGKWGTRNTYSIYYDENGKMNRYDIETGEWIPVN